VGADRAIPDLRCRRETHPFFRVNAKDRAYGRLRLALIIMHLGWRRYFAFAAFAFLATPLVFGLVHPDSPSAILKEGRRLAPVPRAPDAAAGWLALSAAVDAYLNDHFGLRQVMIRAYKDLMRPTFGRGTASVLIGRDGRMFLLGNDMVRQSAGLVVRDQRVTDTANLLAEIHDALAERGTSFLVSCLRILPQFIRMIFRSGRKTARGRPNMTFYWRILQRVGSRRSTCARF
jgi:hypothetical protein